MLLSCAHNPSWHRHWSQGDSRASPVLGLPAVAWASDLTALSFSFPIYKMERL